MRRGRKPKYPLHDMNVWDRVVVPPCSRCVQDYLTYYYGRRLGKRFKTRMLTTGLEIVRIA